MLHKEKGKSAVVDKEVYKVIDSGLLRQIDPAHFELVRAATHGLSLALPSSQETSYHVGEF